MRPHIRTFLCVVLCLAPAFFKINLFAQTSNGLVSRIATVPAKFRVPAVNAPADRPFGEFIDVAFDPNGPNAYLVSGTELQAMDIVTGAALGSVTVASTGSIAIAPDGTRAYVVDAATGNIWIHALPSLAPAGMITTDSGVARLAITPDGLRAYAPDVDNDVVRVIDLVTEVEVAQIVIPAPAPYAIVILPDGTRAYVSVGGASKGVAVLDLTTNTVTGLIDLGLQPLALAASPDGESVFATNASNRIPVISTSSHTVTTPAALSGFGAAVGVSVSPDGEQLIVVDRLKPDQIQHHQATAPFSFISDQFLLHGTVSHYPQDSFVGPPFIDYGTYVVANESTLTSEGFGNRIIINNGAALQLGGSFTTARGIYVAQGTGTVNTAGFDFTATGVGGGSTLVKRGAGTLRLTNANNFTTAIVDEGTLQVDGTLPPMVSVYGSGTLTGSGNVGPVMVNAGSISPGTATTPGILYSDNTTLGNTSTFILNINGTAAGSGYDRLHSVNRSSLGNAQLNVSLGTTPATGDAFLIATNAIGTFKDLGEGATFTAGAVTFRISYVGGDGDDAVLTVMSSPVSVPPPPPLPKVFPPSISAVADQALPMNGATAVSFTVNGAIIPSALQVSVSSSDPGLLTPGSGLVLSHVGEGNWQLTIRGADGRTGTAGVTLTVSDGSQTASTSFNVTVGEGARPPAPGTPGNLRATTGSGGGVVLTWSPVTFDRASAAAAAERYAIAGGTTPGGVDLPVMITAASATSYSIPSLPNGTYYFQVYGVNAGGISSPSEDVSVTLTQSSAAPGPPTGLRGVLSGSTATLEWTPAPQTTNVSQLEIGSTPAATDLGTMTSLTPPFTRDVRMVAPGTYWLRARTLSGGIISGASNDVAITISNGACTAAPAAPVLLPMSVRDGQVTLAWLPAAGAAAERYQINVRATAGGAPLGTFTTTGAVSSFVIGARSGNYAIDVIAENACGVSGASNTITPIVR